ncbi:hypothetical protein JT104_02375 [Helicobacter pylori]|nr:hypothetical protein [Helicobacter pylori]
MLGFVWVFLRPSMVIYHNNKGKKLSLLIQTNLLVQATNYTTNKRKRAAR